MDDLGSLVGEDVSAIAFVRDYVELHFDGPILRAFANPLVRADGYESTFPSFGSRDALCSVIGRKVASVVVTEDSPMGDDRIEVTLDHGVSVVIPLGQEHRAGPEAAHYIPSRPDGSLMIERMHIW